MAYLYESEIEEMAIEELQALGYTYVSGNDLTPDTAPLERKSFADVILRDRCLSALRRINPHLSDGAIESALKALYQVAGTYQVTDNEKFHRYLTDGIPVEYRKKDDVVGDFAYLIDPSDSPGKNEFLAVNQFTIIEKGINKRPDIILFVNGLPLVTFELKNAADLNATVKKAYEQLKTYKAAIPQLFSYNEICVISDGLEAKVGSYTAPFSRFSTWKTKDGLSDASPFEDELSVTLNGLFNRNTLIDYILNFVAFEKAKIENDEKKIIRIETIKKIAAYHQYYAVNKAVASTIHAADKNGNKKAGVVWHTQGSGKSLSMVFYTGKLVKAMNNPTVIVITDRNDLDDQLFDTFADNIELLRQPPQQAESTEQLKDLLRVASGGIIFTTIQKFSPTDGTSKFDMLSDRHNIVVIADEAHRTQYGFDAKLHDIKDKDNNVIGQRVSYGFAKYMHDALPNATTAEVIDELIKIAQDLKKADMRSLEMGLSSDELAFYDALSLNDSATEVLGDEQLRIIAREVADKVRKNATIDWAVKESVRARLMVIVRRILKKYGYPPDKQEQAIQLVMTQAANLADDWAQE